MTIIALSGGVGGAKLARGLARVLPPGQLTVVCNTGDDFEHFGLHIAPDLDSVMYALAGLTDPQRGWGRVDETWQFMDAARALGLPGWFNLGDRDLATHVLRTERLRAGASLTEATAELTQRFGLNQTLLPMSDRPVRTQLDTDHGRLAFQDYFVRHRAAPRVLGMEFAGAAKAMPPLQPAALNATLIVLCPSNPYLSIDPILAIPGWRDWLRARSCPVVAVSPIVAGDALKGCAAKMMREFGEPCEPLTVARHYGELLDGFVLDEQDRSSLPAFDALGLPALACQTVMRSDADREQLAREVLDFGRSLNIRARDRIGADHAHTAVR